MRPEKKTETPKPEVFIKIGVPQEWVDIVMHEYLSISKLKESKATQVHQNLNGLRKKNKLPIAALKLEDVEKWF
jgi:lysyl-tRNA synthetase class 2